MNNFKYSLFFFLITSIAYSQKYYDFNDLNYFIDFSNRRANIKFQDFSIKGSIEEIISFSISDIKKIVSTLLSSFLFIVLNSAKS